MFVCFLSAEVLPGKKHNMEVAFPRSPHSLEEFYGHCECVLNNERRRLMLRKLWGLTAPSPCRTASPARDRAADLTSTRRLENSKGGMSNGAPHDGSSGWARVASLEPSLIIRTVRDPPLFLIDVVKVFDETTSRWLDVHDISQLSQPWAQFYAFPKSNAGKSDDDDADGDDHKPSGSSPTWQADYLRGEDEKQDVIPAPVRIRSPAVITASNSSGVYLSPTNEKKKPSTGSPVSARSPMDPIFFLFHDIDVDGTGFVNREELQRIFNVLGCFDVSEKSVDEMFLVYDGNRDGLLSFAEFSRLAAGLPLVTETLLSQSREYWSAREKLERRWSSGGEHEGLAPVAGQGLSLPEHVEAVRAYLHRREEIIRGHSALDALRRTAAEETPRDVGRKKHPHTS
jgi:hypothetical protein